MKELINYLDEMKKKYGSDYASAKKINVSKQSISTIRKGGNIKDETAVKIAEALGIDEKEILLAAAIARSKGKAKEVWQEIAKKSGLAASLMLAMGWGGYPDFFSVTGKFNGLICILCKITKVKRKRHIFC